MGLGFVLLVGVLLSGCAAVPIALVLAYFSWRNSRAIAAPSLRRAVAAGALPFLLIALTLAWFGGYAAFCVFGRGVDPGIGDSFMVPLANGYSFCMIDTAARAFILKNGCGGVPAVDGVRQLSVRGDVVVGASRDAPGFVFDTRTGGLTRLHDSAAALAQVPAAAPLLPPDEFYFSRRYGWPDAAAVLLLVAMAAGLVWFWCRRFIRAPRGAAPAASS